MAGDERARGGDDLSTALRPRRETAEEIAAPFDLVVVDGPDRGARLRIDETSPPRVLVGQSPVCDLRLADREVSRRHAAIEPVAGALRILDLGSKNGTFVNGVGIESASLNDGQTIRLGATTITVARILSSMPARFSRSMRFGGMIGASPEMRRLYPQLERLAKADIPVVIEGETGTGKEVVAEAIHAASARKSGPFVVFDCTAVPDHLVESALFGHERGAFTGAHALRRGAFEEANGGTLLLDEIGELDVALQPKLLRAIERGEVQRVGAAKWTSVDVRVLAATRRDLDREVQEGRFRDDLFFRLAVGRVELPPLRRRRGDVAVLARHFWHELGGDPRPLPNDLLRSFEAYAWPGNVRELHNAIARYLALGDALTEEASDVAWAAADDGRQRDDLVERILARELPLARARQHVVEEFERRYVERVLARYGGNVVRAAAASGIARRYFQILRARRNA